MLFSLEMLLTFTILAIVLAFAALVGFLAGRTVKRLPAAPSEQKLITNYPNDLRPLFQPEEADIRAFEKAERERRALKEAENSIEELAKKAEKVEGHKRLWQISPSRANTVELFYLASQSENGKVYRETSGEILELWKKGRIDDLKSHDLAQLLESHFWLLPEKERTSGDKFWLQNEIASLRRESVEEN